MKLPLVIYSLVLCGLWLYRIIAPRGRAEELFANIFPSWALMTTVALLSITFGKPGLGPQYAAWIVVVMGLLRIVSFGKKNYFDRLLEVISLIAIIYLWFYQLPLGLRLS